MNLRLAVQRAIRLHSDSELAAAADTYWAILKRHPKTCACWSLTLGMALRTLGNAHEEAGDHERARKHHRAKEEGLEALRQGVRVCPQHVGLNQNLGNALEDAGDHRGVWEQHSQSVDRYQAALKVVPYSAAGSRPPARVGCLSVGLGPGAAGVGTTCGERAANAGRHAPERGRAGDPRTRPGGSRQSRRGPEVRRRGLGNRFQSRRHERCGCVAAGQKVRAGAR